MIMFGVLAVRTALSIKCGGVEGSSSYCERLSAIVALSITVTFLIFWGLLAPYMGSSEFFTYSNMQPHTFTPLLFILDYFLFTEPGHLKKQDPWWFALVPFAYFVQATIFGFSGVQYGISGGTTTRFPYFFIDFDLLGARVFLYVGCITVFFVALAYLLLFFDKRRGARHHHTQK
jgi:hypothetical protein